MRWKLGAAVAAVGIVTISATPAWAGAYVELDGVHQVGDCLLEPEALARYQYDGQRRVVFHAANDCTGRWRIIGRGPDGELRGEAVAPLANGAIDMTVDRYRNLSVTVRVRSGGELLILKYPAPLPWVR